jgi:hypothetical protein
MKIVMSLTVITLVTATFNTQGIVHANPSPGSDALMPSENNISSVE